MASGDTDPLAANLRLATVPSDGTEMDLLSSWFSPAVERLLVLPDTRYLGIPYPQTRRHGILRAWMDRLAVRAKLGVGAGYVRRAALVSLSAKRIGKVSQSHHAAAHHQQPRLSLQNCGTRQYVPLYGYRRPRDHQIRDADLLGLRQRIS